MFGLGGFGAGLGKGVGEAASKAAAASNSVGDRDRQGPGNVGGSGTDSTGDRDRQGPGNVGGGGFGAPGGGHETNHADPGRETSAPETNRPDPSRTGMAAGLGMSATGTAGVGTGLSGGMLNREINRDRLSPTTVSYDRTRALSETGPTAREMQMASVRRAAENKSMADLTASTITRDLTAGLAKGAPAPVAPATAKTVEAIGTYESLSPKEKFLADTYAHARQAGLSDVQARLAAAQSAQETSFGQSLVGNNYFGIKAGKSWNGKSVRANTQEEVDGKRVTIKDNFRAYDNPADSFKDWARMVERNWPDAYNASTFDDAVNGLKAGQQGGYATASNYGTAVHSMDKKGAKGRSVAEFAKGGVWGKTSPTATASTFADKYLSSNPVSDRERQLASADFFGETPSHEYDSTPADIASTDQPATTTAPTQVSGTPTDIGTITKPAGGLPDDAKGLYGKTPTPLAGDFPDRPRSTGEKIAAMGVDVGLGMLPAVGMPISLINGGLALTGNRTLGERFVDAVATGEGGTYQPGEGDPRRPEVVAKLDDKKKTTVPEKPTSFEEKYLAFVDPVKRPTPGEKWGTSASYA